MQLEKVGMISEAVGQLHVFQMSGKKHQLIQLGGGLSFFYLPETAQTICNY